MICVKKNLQKEPEIIFILGQTFLGVRIYPFIRYTREEAEAGDPLNWEREQQRPQQRTGRRPEALGADGERTASSSSWWKPGRRLDPNGERLAARPARPTI
jgi:hypothetical protein